MVNSDTIDGGSIFQKDSNNNHYKIKYVEIRACTIFLFYFIYV